MKRKFKVERVTKGNFDDFLFLVERLAEYEKLSPPDADARRRLRRDCLSKRPGFEAYLGRFGDEYVAYVIYLYTYSSFLARPTMFIEDVFVQEKFRKRGIGQKMWELCVRRAKETGCGRLEFIVLDWNKPAQKFYEKNKAKRMNWHFYRLELK